jgi:hypothetical protein
MTIRCTYNGKHIVPDDPSAVQRYKDSLVPLAKIAMTLEPWEDRRTRSQQGLLHEILGRLARAQGMSLNVVKMQIKCHIGYYVPADKILSGEIIPKWRGAFVDEAKVYEGYPSRLLFVRSEADYTKRMEGEFIDFVMQICADVGVYVDDIIETMSHD